MKRLFKCRRGVAGLMVTAVAVPLVTMAGLGAEAGSWYFIRRAAQNAADAAAMAGAMAIVAGQSASTEGARMATKDGFTNGATTSFGATQSVTVAVTSPGGVSTVTATVIQRQPTMLARVMMAGPVPITARATVQIQDTKAPCALGLKGLTIGGSAVLSGGNCSLTSNADVKFNSSATFSGTGWAVDASKGCGPNDGKCQLTNASYNYFAPPTLPPKSLTDLQTLVTFPAEPKNPTKLSCKSTTCAALTPSTTVWQGDLTVQAGGIQNLTAGTYLFDSITLTGGALVSCTAQPASVAASLTCTPNAGVNIVIGSGGLKVSGGADVNLKANPLNATFPDLDGVLIYDTEGTAASPTNISINGNSASIWAGAMYFPNGNVTWNGNGTPSNNCTEIIANTLTISGNSNFQIGGCPANSQPIAQIIVLAS